MQCFEKYCNQLSVTRAVAKAEPGRSMDRRVTPGEDVLYERGGDLF
jgi:hypothetical protein